MKTKERIAKILQEISNSCEYCKGNDLSCIGDFNRCNQCNDNYLWLHSDEKALEIAERILE